MTSCNLALTTVETNPFWLKFLATHLPHYPSPTADVLLESLEASLLRMKEENSSQVLLPVAMIFVQKISNLSIFFLAVGMTRQQNYVFLNARNLEKPLLTSDDLHEFCMESFTIASTNYKVKVRSAVVDLIEVKCNEFFEDVDFKEYIVTRPLHQIVNSLKSAQIDVPDITDDENLAVSTYRDAVNDLKNSMNEHNSFGETFVKLIDLIESGKLKANSKWFDAVLPYIKAFSLGLMYMIPAQKKKVVSADFLKEFQSVLDKNEALQHFYFRVIPYGDATKYFSYYKDFSGEFPYAFSHYNTKGPRFFWEKLLPLYFGLSEFALDLLKIPAAPKPLNVKAVFELMSDMNFDLKNSFLMYRIFITLRNC